LQKLRSLGFSTLNNSADFYGDGLALGNGEVSLWEMTQAYAALARNGVGRPLHVLQSEDTAKGVRIFSDSAASLTGNVLSDANARRLEFGRGGSMDFPVQTAVKTGTSTDYRDAWAFAYNYKFVIGVWMGNLDERPTRGLTGSTVPMLIARALMNRVLIGQDPRPLIMNPKLRPRKICREGTRLYDFDGACAPWTEYFTSSDPLPRPVVSTEDRGFQVSKPTQGMNMAWDPRLPAKAQAFRFEVEGIDPSLPVKWFVNGKLLAKTQNGSFDWPLAKGQHLLRAEQGTKTSSRTFFVR
jgi:penicillin-binding protein 1C